MRHDEAGRPTYPGAGYPEAKDLPLMSAPTEPRGGDSRKVGGTGRGTAWPVRSDQGRRSPQPDLFAAALTVLAGAAAAGQLFLSWTSMVSGVGLQDADGGVTGWERFLAARTAATLSNGNGITAYSVIGTALAGGALLLLGLAMLLPIDHRPLASATLVLSFAALAAVLWWLVRGFHTFNQSLSELFSHAGPGWYLFLLAGPLGVAGSLKAFTGG